MDLLQAERVYNTTYLSKCEWHSPKGSTTCETGFTMFAYIFNLHEGFATAYYSTTGWLKQLLRVYTKFKWLRTCAVCLQHD